MIFLFTHFLNFTPNGGMKEDLRVELNLKDKDKVTSLIILVYATFTT